MPNTNQNNNPDAKKHIPNRNSIKELSDFDKSCLDEFQITQLGIKFHTNPLDGITFPTLPYNFDMLMSDLDWPAKAMKNPNGTLFMHPGEIDDSPADDLGLQCFSQFDDPAFLSLSYDTSKTKNITIKDASSAKDDFEARENYNPFLNNTVLQYIAESSDNMIGISMDPKDIKARNEAFTTMYTDVSKAISTYITRSLSIINPVVQLVAGQGAGSAIDKVRKIIISANSAGLDGIKYWIDSYDSIEKEKNDKEASVTIKGLQNEADAQKKAVHFMQCFMLNNYVPAGKTPAEVSKILSNYIFSRVRDGSTLNRFIKTFSGLDSYKAFTDVMKARYKSDSIIAAIPTGNGTGVTLTLAESSVSVFKKRLNEDVGDATSWGNPIDYDELYTKIYGAISNVMNEVIGPRVDWVCMKSLEEAMKNLKDRADAEITKRIEIICKTGGQKSLVHWPLKAEGLLTVWNRYSAELNIRMKNRLDQLTGSGGGRETGSANMVEDFLRNTYPRIIAAMLTYKLMFEQLAAEYRKNLALYVTWDNVDPIVEGMTDIKVSNIITILLTFDSLTNSNNP